MYGNIINEAFGKVTAKSLNVFITQIKCNAYAVLQISMKRLSLIFGCKKGCKSRNYLIYTLYCGERGIRTPGTSRYDGFQDRCNRPLYHLSLRKNLSALDERNGGFCFVGAKIGFCFLTGKFLRLFLFYDERCVCGWGSA